MRKVLKTVLTWSFSGFVLVVLVALLREWLVQVARDKGLYENAGQNWDRVLGTILDFATSPWAIYPLTALGGVVMGMWIDGWAKHFDKTHPSRKDREKNDRVNLSKELIRLAREIEKTIGDPDLSHLFIGLESEVIVMMNRLAALGYFVPRPFPETDDDSHLIKNLRMSAGYYRSVSPLIREDYHLARTEGDNWGFDDEDKDGKPQAD